MDETKDLLVGGYLMTEDEYEKFDKAVTDSGPIYDTDRIYKVVADIIKTRIDELY